MTQPEPTPDPADRARPARASALERWFGVREAGSTPTRELLGGLTTFLTMAYIAVVNPDILAQAGIPRAGAVAATCLGAALGTLLMGLIANYPIALAPGMGLNAFFTFTLCKGAGMPWQTALGIVFWSGVLCVILTASGARQRLVDAVSPTLKLATAAGIGLFIAFIGLSSGGVVIAQPATLVQLGQLAQPPALYTVVGLLLTLILISARVPAAIFWGVVGTTGLGIALRQIALPTSLAAWPSLDLPGFQIDLWGALAPRYWPLLLVLVFFDLFDKLGTLLGVAHEGGFLVDGKLPRAGRALVADSSATVAGALLGTSPVTSFIESGSGVAIGARTGLANLVTAACFLVALCFAPLVGAVAGFPPATAPALITVGVLMTKAVAEIDWSDLTEALPAFFTMLLIPLTFSISHGLAIGVIVYAVVKTAAGRGREVHWLIYALAAAFALQYALLPVSA